MCIYAAYRLMVTNDPQVQSVTQERIKEIVDVTDLTKPDDNVRTAYNAIMRGWLRDDKREASWDRVVMVSVTNSAVPALQCNYARQ